MAARCSALLQISLVIFLRAVKRTRRRNFRRNRPPEFSARFQSGLRFLRRGFLLRRVKENGRTVLRPYVRPLPVHLRGIMHQDRKSTRLNSSHMSISYAVFCLKKKKKK